MQILLLSKFIMFRSFILINFMSKNLKKTSNQNSWKYNFNYIKADTSEDSTFNLKKKTIVKQILLVYSHAVLSRRCNIHPDVRWISGKMLFFKILKRVSTNSFMISNGYNSSGQIFFYFFNHKIIKKKWLDSCCS